ncbi:ATP-binding protein (plasmid) [Sorangium sp. So ce119]|uniref:AlbA family DNA-binding domain-containing protein n=1 Tax=Sorangium sp. So ce119 TaxID=3133279 RepID=UPI003F60E1FB
MSALRLLQWIEQERWSAIQSMIAEKTPEGIHLDFKRSQDNGRGPSLGEDDHKNLAKSMSAFANTDGGIVIFGIQTLRTSDGDRADQICAIDSVERFAKLVRDRLDDICDPKIMNVRVDPIKDPDSNGSGVVMIYVPPGSAGPHRSRSKRAPDFYMRTELGATPMPYTVLAALFGRPPSPRLAVQISQTRLTHLGIWLVNRGSGAARSPYIRIEIWRHSDRVRLSAENQAVGWYRDDARSMDGSTSLGFYMDQNRSFYPQYEKHVVDICGNDDSIGGYTTIKGLIFCENAPPIEFESPVSTIRPHVCLPEE